MLPRKTFQKEEHKTIKKQLHIIFLSVTISIYINTEVCRKYFIVVLLISNYLFNEGGKKGYKLPSVCLLSLLVQIYYNMRMWRG